MANVRFDGTDPVMPGKGRPIVIAGDRNVLESAIGAEAEIEAIRRWMADPTFAAPLGRTAGDPGDAVVRGYIGRFDRLLNHLFIVRNGERREVGMATAGIDGNNRIAWIEVMVGDRTRRDTQIILADAARALTRWVFDDLGLAKLSVQCAASNARTAAWLDMRMTREATLRDELLLPDGRRETLLRYALLASEWPAARQAYQDRDAAGTPPTTPRPPR